jgi:hypothetical protein
MFSRALAVTRGDIRCLRASAISRIAHAGSLLVAFVHCATEHATVTRVSTDE